jgi:molybdopterin molybdotransferase
VRELPTIDEALALVLARVAPLEAEETPVEAAVGRVLAEAAAAGRDLPPFASSGMDGFAVRSADTPGELAVVARVAAGSPSAHQLAPGEAMAISTGAAVPDGADAVVPVELVDDRGATVLVADAVAAGASVRARGSDVRKDETIAGAGARIGPAQLGALAASGLTTVRCSRRPTLAIVVTGGELRAPGEALGPGQIYDANGAILAAQALSAGAVVERAPTVGDDETALRAALGRGLGADVLVTTGGVSVGEHDLVRASLVRLGVEEVFWGVAVRPGRPIAFGVAGRTLVFGLPGNPVSTLVGFELFVRPALLALQGAADPGPELLPGRLGVAVRQNAARDELLRSRMRIEADAVVLEPLAGQESHMIVRAAGANALAVVRRGDGELPAGAPVRYLRL